MARTRRSIQPLNLYKYDVLIEEKGMRSDYFKITQFDGYFYGGRNAFLLAGSGVFRPNSKILVEILNKEGETVYSVPVSSYVEGNSRLIQVEVYSDTPIGPGKIVVMGSVDQYIDGTPVPDEWKGKYNVRWVSDVIISPLVENKTPIRFEKTPTLVVNEKFYSSPSSSQFTETVVEPIDIEVSPKFYNVFPNGYILKLRNTSPTSFSSEFIGGKISGSITFDGPLGLEIANIDLPITKIYNKNVAETEGNLIYTRRNTLITSIFLSSSGTYSSSVNSQYSTVVSSSVNLIYSKLDAEATGSNISFTEVRIVDLETISGEIHKVRLSYKSSTAPGEYVLLSEAGTGVRELFAIDSGSKVVNTGDFSKISIPEYWYNATMSLLPNEQVESLPQYYYSSSLVDSSSIYKNNIDIIDGISATPSIVGGDFIDNKSYFIGTSNINFGTLFPRSEYTLTFNAFASKVTGSQELSQSDYSMEVYLVSQEESDSSILSTDPRGQFLGKLTPTSTFKKQNFEKVEFNFVPKITKSGKYGLRFIVFGGHWSISNVSVKPSEEPFFSPDEVNLLIPLENQENDILTFRAEFYDVTNNSSGIDIFSIPTYITGSSNYVKKTGDYMTGELYINGLPIQQQALQDGFTGLVSGGIITVNTPATWSYTISSGSGYVIDNYSNPLQPVYTYVEWPQISKMPLAFSTTGSIASYPRTNIAISASGQVIEQSAEWTPLDYRRYIILGRIAHVGTTSIQRALSLPLTTYNRGFHWFDLANAIGIINVEGNTFYASGSSMRIGKTAGKTYRVGSNYRNDTTYPDITTDPSSLPTSFAYRYRSGSGFAEEPISTFITGTYYDDGSGILATVNPNKFTVQRIYYFGATNTTRIQFGQNIYNTIEEAQATATSEIFTVDPNLERDAALRAYLIVGSSATDLSNLAQAEFITVGKFSGGGAGGGGGGGGGATALSGLTDVNLSGPNSGQLLQYNGTVWVNGTNITTLATTGSNSFVGNQLITGSLIVSGSSTLTNIGPAIFSGSLNVTDGITGSLLGTGSWAASASRAVTSSYINPTGLPIGTVSSSQQINTGSFSGSITSASFAITSSFARNYILPIGTVSSSQQINTGSFSGSITSASFAISASWTPVVLFPFTGSAAISGSLLVSGTVSNALTVLAASSPTITIQGNTSPTFNIQGNGGTGSITVGSDVRLGSVTNIDLSFIQNNAVAWYINTSKNLIPLVNNSYDIGLTGTRVRTVWATNISSSNPINSASFAATSSYVTPAGLPIGTISSSGQVDHNATTNYSANRHIDHTAVSIVAGTGLVGGGDISSTRTINALFIPSTDNRSVNNPPASASAGLYADFKTNTTDGLVDGGTYHGVLTFRPYGTTSDFSGGPAYQEAFTENGNAYLRSGSSNTWSSWRKFAYETGSLLGTSSYASTASVAISASWAPAAGLTGGTTNYIPLWTGTGTLSSSAIYQSSNNISINSSTPTNRLTVNGDVGISGSTGISHGILMNRSGWGSAFRLGAISSSGDDFWITNNWNPQTNAQDTSEAGYITLAPKNELRTVINGTRIATVNSTGVGIGTTNPDTNLSVVKSSGGLPASSGTTPTNAITRIKASANNAMFMGMDTSSPYGGWIQVSDITGLGTNYPILLNPNGGNIGIGTTSPDSILHVASPSTLNWKLQNTGGGGSTVASYAGVGTGSVGTLTNHAFFVYTNNTERMRFDIAGNVGVGTTTPTRKLQVGTLVPDVVNSDLAATLVVSGGIMLAGNNWLTFDHGYAVHGRIRWDATATSTENALKIDSYYGHDFQTRSGTSRMVIRGDSGNVGIGTISPANNSKLDVADGKIRAGTNTSTQGTTIIEGAYSNGAITTFGTEYSSGGPVLGYGVTPSTASADAFFSSTGINVQRGAYVIAGGVHKWSSAGVSTATIGTVVSLTEYMRLTDVGRLGIGVTNPQAKLDVNGGIAINSVNAISASANYIQLFRQDGNIGIYLGGNTDPGNYYDNTNHYFRDRSSNVRWQINSSGHLLAGTDNSYDIGASGATRPRDIFVARNLNVGGRITASNAINAQSGLIVLGNKIYSEQTINAGAGINVQSDSGIYWTTGSFIDFGTPPLHGGITFRSRGLEFYAGGITTPRMFITASNGNVGIGTITPQTILDISGSGGIRHTSGSVSALLRANPTSNAVEFGAETFHVVNMLINGSSLYQFGVGAFLATNPAYTLGTTINPWATVYSSVYSSSISNAVGYFGTASYAVSASWAPSAGTVQSTTSGGPLNIYIAQTFGGF